MGSFEIRELCRNRGNEYSVDPYFSGKLRCDSTEFAHVYTGR